MCSIIESKYLAGSDVLGNERNFNCTIRSWADFPYMGLESITRRYGCGEFRSEEFQRTRIIATDLADDAASGKSKG